MNNFFIVMFLGTGVCFVNAQLVAWPATSYSPFFERLYSFASSPVAAVPATGSAIPLAASAPIPLVAAVPPPPPPPAVAVPAVRAIPISAPVLRTPPLPAPSTITVLRAPAVAASTAQVYNAPPLIHHSPIITGPISLPAIAAAPLPIIADVPAPVAAPPLPVLRAPIAAVAGDSSSVVVPASSAPAIPAYAPFARAAYLIGSNKGVKVKA